MRCGRRAEVIGRSPGETSCLTLAWVVMDRVIAGAHGPGLTLPERQLIATRVIEREAPRIERQVA